MKGQMERTYAMRHPVERLRLRLRLLLLVAGTLTTGFGLFRLWQLGAWP